MSERLEVDAPTSLLVFLKGRLDGWRVKTLRDRLRQGCVLVNGERVTRNDHPLQAGDRVEVGLREERPPRTNSRSVFNTLHADRDLIAIDKPPGLLSVSTDRQNIRTALALLRTSLSPPGRPVRLWPVHRLDRETSGVLLFARSREMRDALQATWTETQKVYLAIVEGHPKPAQGVIDQPLWEDSSLNVRVGRRPESKDARTRYRTREHGRRRALLEVELLTGRRHQIRAHLIWLGHPVVGDRRYGTAGPRMGLHALQLHITHPRDGERLVFEAKPPKAFRSLLDRDRQG